MAESKSRREILAGAIATGVVSIVAAPTAISQVVRRTPSQILGPFYPLTKPRDQDADLTVIAGKTGRAQGQVIYVSGRVLTREGKPVRDARIEIWQANTHGRYTHPSDTHDAPLDPNFEGYAAFTTDAEGTYAFKTIQPGGYPEDGGRLRAPHIHFDVSGRTNRLVTQLYFSGETLNDQDRFLSTAGANRERLIVKLGASPSGRDAGSLSGTWDIVLNDG